MLSQQSIYNSGFERRNVKTNYVFAMVCFYKSPFSKETGNVSFLIGQSVAKPKSPLQKNRPRNKLELKQKFRKSHTTKEFVGPKCPQQLVGKVTQNDSTYTECCFTQPRQPPHLLLQLNWVNSNGRKWWPVSEARKYFIKKKIWMLGCLINVRYSVILRLIWLGIAQFVH